MTTLMDGTVIPSYQGVSDTRYPQSAAGGLTNNRLRVGEIIELIPPKSEKSVSKKYMEYRVRVQFGGGDTPGFTTEYSNAYIPNLFGGFADQFKYTLRADTKKDEKKALGIGSKVLLFCINNETANAVIISGLRDSGLDTVEDDADLGHNLYFSFNGISFAIDKDGATTLQFRGATDEKGKPKSDSAPKEGVVTIRIDKDKKIRIKSDAKVILECENIQLGSEDPSDNLTLASKCMQELNKLKDWASSMQSTFNSHDHMVSGIQTAGTPVAHTQTVPVNTMSPGSQASAPKSVDEVKSTVVKSK